MACGLCGIWAISIYNNRKNIRSFSTNKLMWASECVSVGFRLKLSFIEKYFLNFSIPDSRIQRTIVKFYHFFDLVHIFHGVELIRVANPFDRMKLNSIVSNNSLKMFCFWDSADLHFIASTRMYTSASALCTNCGDIRFSANSKTNDTI